MAQAYFRSNPAVRYSKGRFPSVCHVLSYAVSFILISYFFFCFWGGSYRAQTKFKLYLEIITSFQETTFIEQIVEDESQMEGIPVGCYGIMNWHLHLEASGLAYPKGWTLQKNLDVVFPSM